MANEIENAVEVLRERFSAGPLEPAGATPSPLVPSVRQEEPVIIKRMRDGISTVKLTQLQNTVIEEWIRLGSRAKVARALGITLTRCRALTSRPKVRRYIAQRRDEIAAANSMTKERLVAMLMDAMEGKRDTSPTDRGILELAAKILKMTGGGPSSPVDGADEFLIVAKKGRA